MLRLSKIVKSYKETGALNEHVAIFGFLDEQVFLTKGGDVALYSESRELITSVWITSRPTA
jgi:hypothetical protein